MIDKSEIKDKVVELVAKQAEKKGCGVKDCPNGDAELVELKPFDPIDHEATYVALCPTHTVWADKRNEFAEEMADELREARKEIGQANIGRIQELSMPQGELREDILMGEAEGQIPLEEAFEDSQDSLSESDLLGDSV